jgi:sulfur-carrier protein
MRVVLSGNLMRFASFEKEVEVEATTVAQAVDALVQKFPDLQPVVFDGAGALRKVHRLYLNGDLLAFDALNTAVAPSDELGVLTAIAGG